MTEECLTDCLTALRTMKAGADMPWGEIQRRQYGRVLAPMTDEEGRALIDHIYEHEEWRPSVKTLLDTAAALTAPIPDADACYDEIAHLAETVGLYGACLPERPSIRQLGAPKFSHPIVGRIVNYCGGWGMICSGEANMAEGLRKQVRSSWESVAGEWRERVREALKLPPDQRNPGLFRTYQPYRLPVGWAPTPVAELPAVDELPQYDIDKRTSGGLTRFRP